MYILHQLLCQMNFAMLNFLISSCLILPSDRALRLVRENACRLLTPAVVSTAHAQLHNYCISDSLSTRMTRVK